MKNEPDCTIYLLFLVFFLGCRVFLGVMKNASAYIYLYYVFLVFYCFLDIIFFGVRGVVLPMKNVPACTIYLLVLDVFIVLFLGCHVFLQSGE